MKLLEVERELNIYGRHDAHLAVSCIINVDIKDLKEIIKPMRNDELLYCSYPLGKKQLINLAKIANLNIIPERKTYRYYLECNGIYDYNK